MQESQAWINQATLVSATAVYSDSLAANQVSHGIPARIATTITPKSSYAQRLWSRVLNGTLQDRAQYFGIPAQYADETSSPPVPVESASTPSRPCSPSAPWRSTSRVRPRRSSPEPPKLPRRSRPASARCSTSPAYRPDQLYRLNALATDIVNAAIPDQIRLTTTFAVDGTDIESWANAHTARRRRRAGKGPRIPDPEASMGHRTASQNAKDMFYGHMAHLATDLPEFGFQGNHVPLIRAVAMASNAEGVTARAGIEAIDEVRELMPVEHVIADRGYTFAIADKWARPLAERGIR